MSNCINIYNDTVIPFDQIKHIDWLRNLIQSEPPYDHDDYSNRYILYWFLTPKNVKFDYNAKEVIISFGLARSSHTWRDFKNTLRFIGKFLKDRRTMADFIIADEFDGYQTQETISINFRNPQ